MDNRDRAPTFTLRVDAAPVAKPRMTQRDKWLPSKPAQRYFSWANIVGLLGNRLFLVPIGRPVTLSVTFHMPFPRSYSRARRRELVGRPHHLKPDIKNLIAGVEDALNGIAWKDDALIWEYYRCQKFWTDGPGLTVIDIWTDLPDIHRLSTEEPDQRMVTTGSI